MTITSLIYKRDVTYNGKNGICSQKGIRISKIEDPDVIKLIPLNTRGQLSKCYTEIPIEDVANVIEALKRFLP